MRIRLLAAVAALLLAAPAAAGAATRQVPAGWLGVTAGGPMLDQPVDLNVEAQLMADAGVESVRLPVFWNDLQPTPGTPDLSLVDRLVGAAAARRLRVLPVVTGTPGWARLRPRDYASPPRGTAAYAAFVVALVRRYGASGSFWAEHPELPRVPIRAIQVFNEVSLRGHWSVQPFARAYVALLRATYRAIKREDSRMLVVLAGLPNYSWRDLPKVYRAGGRPWFDLAAVHPYTFAVANVVRIVRLNREVMARFGDARKPILLTEVSWSSGRGYVRETAGFLALTEQGQAQRVGSVLTALAAVRARYRIAGVYWYDWLSPPLGVSGNAFAYAGLRRQTSDGIVSKPALSAYRRAALRLEGR
jgi:polysaccharide biosynthesis protein PslG